MATIYNLTNATNSTNLYDIAVAANSASGDVLGTVLLTTMFFITLVSMKGWQTPDAFAATSFGYSIIALLFYFANLISWTILFMYAILGAFGAFILIKR